MNAGPKRLIPAGHVDALCLGCRPNGGRAVVIPEGATACPDCGQDIEPLSLPSVPGQHRQPSVQMAPTADDKPPAPLELIVLPDWIDGARSWHAATVKLAGKLAIEEAVLVGELRRVRGLRKLLDAVLARVESTPGGTS
jgi:hypothetical protein